MKILIPTCNSAYEPAPVKYYSPDCDIIKTGFPLSAAKNRNYCLDHVIVGEIAIMLDDDIEGFYEGWVGDLIKPMEDPAVVMVSARLLNPDGSFGSTCSRCYDPDPEEIEIKSNGVCILPTAAISFRHRGHRFDENFVGSGFEDNDWCQQYLSADPGAKFIQSNLCRLIHRNEMKNQKGKIWNHNMLYFHNKWTQSRVTA